MQVNPIIDKDLKTKMRGWKAPTLVSVYLGFLLLVVFLFFFFNNNQQMYNYGYSNFSPRIAINAFNTLALIQLIMLLFITPALTGGAISGERERQTLDLLLCTSFSPFKIVIGKIFVSIAHILLLITASLPIISIVFLYGGVSLTDILLLFLFFIATAFMLGSLGVFYSTIFKKTIVAIIVTYLTILIITAGTVIVMLLWREWVNTWFNTSMYIRYEPTYKEMASFLFPNPFFGFGSVIEGTATNNSFFGTFVGLANGTIFAQNNGEVVVKSWMLNILFDVVMSAILIFFSTKRIKPAK
ncbi:MAG: ABC transporter permease [Clostridiaceae bacterium]|nr:ABC transporter permease [Clostridiaceae bacterium]